MVLKSSFEQPIGSANDVKELEYIAALHKTGEDSAEELVKPAVRAEDVQCFLISRYGIRVSREEVLTQIFEGLAGGDSEDDCLDIIEIVAILIIPYLAKLVSEKDYKAAATQQLQSSMLAPIKKIHSNEEELDLLSVDGSSMTTDVLNIILADVFGSCKPKRLNKEILREIFSTYGELDLIDDDDLLDEMINAATGGDPNCTMLNPETFARALTDDLHLYDIDAETRVSTNYEDVFGTVADGRSVILQPNNDEENMQAVQRDKKLQTVFSFSPLDFLAGTFRVKSHFIIVWVALVFSFASYRGGGVTGGGVTTNVCSQDVDHFGCTLANSIVGWIATLTIFTCLGTPFVIILSLGNQVEATSLWEILIGLAGIAVLIFLPAFSTFKWEAWDNVILQRQIDEGAGTEVIMTVFNTAIGCILTLFQLWNLVRWYNKGKISENSIAPGGAVTDETRIKQASKLKVARMVRNAYDLHEGPKDQSTNQSSLLKFNQISSGELTKPVGGLVWCWTQLLSGKLLSEQGIWIPAKLIVGNIAMFFVCAIWFMIFIVVSNVIVRDIFPKDALETNSNNTTEVKCHPMFDPLTCSFPKDKNGKYYGVAICNMYLPECVDSKTDVLSESLQLALYCSLLQDAYTQNSNAFQYADYLQNPYIDVGAALGNITGDGTIPDFSPCSTIDALSPKFIMPKSNESIYAITPNTIDETDYCASPMTACAKYTIPGTSDTSAMCILGLYSGPDVFNNKVLPHFIGTSCGNYSTIVEINKEHEGVDELTNVNFDVSKSVFSAVLFTGPCFALVCGMLTNLGFIPSLIITMLKFRSGVIPLLRDKKLVLYRTLLQSTTRLIGALFWGAVFSFFLYAIGISGFVFFILWKPTQKFFLQVIAIGIGIAITIALRMLVVAKFKSFFAGFYRKKSPAFGNIFNLALESWDFGITSGYVVLRFIKIILVTFSYIGRFDTPLLSEEANNAGCFYVDTYPLILRSCLLGMDAHRHPYLERLGLLYMMKLKFGNQFGRRSGSMWRLLFVFALMPWLRKFRVSDETDIDENIVQEMYGSKDKKLVDLQTEIKRLKSSRFLFQDDDTADKSDEDEPFIKYHTSTSTRFNENKQEKVDNEDENLSDDLSLESDTDGPTTKPSPNKRG